MIKTVFLNLIVFVIFQAVGLCLYAQKSEQTPAKIADETVPVTAAKIAGFTIVAETLDRDIEKGLVQLSGHVQIMYQTQHFEADYVEINLKKKHAHFRGHVKINSVDYNIGGDEVSLDYFANQALIHNGFVKSNNITFQGSLIEQRGPKTFFVVDADYTTCTNCPSTWSFQSSQIRAELGGYAFLKNAFLKVSDIPILWLPYLVVPLKNERQSGFLAPEFGYIRNYGLVFSDSFFWAISRSQDFTLTFKNYELGGLKTLGEYRYAVSDFSFGQYKASHLNDAVFLSTPDNNHYLQNNEKNKNYRRWSFQGYSQQEIADQTTGRLKLNLVSDLQYPKDFYEEFKSYGEGALESRLNLSHINENSLAQLDSIYYKNLLASNPLQSNDSAVQVLPELKYDITSTKIADTPFYYKFNAQYDNFYRQRKWDDISTTGSQKFVSNTKNDPTCEHVGDPNCSPSYDGVFNEGTDLQRTGQRLFYKASLQTEAFTPADYLTVSPEASYNEAHYFFNEGSDQYNVRKFAQLNINSRSRLYKIYESENAKNKYKHEFIPELNYSYIPFVEQKTNSFFGNIPNGEYAFSTRNNVSDNDLNTPNGLQYDYYDRVYDRHVITLTLLNRIVKKKLADNSYKNILDFRLSQSYDLYQVHNKYAGQNQPLSDLSGVLTLNIDQFTFTNQFNYYPYLSATNTSSALSFLNDQQQYFKIGFNSKTTEQPKTNDLILALGFVTKYINVLSGFIVDTNENRSSSSRLKNFSLITQLKPPGECWGVNFYRDQKPGRDAQWRVSFDFSFDGKPPKIIPPDELNIR